MGLTTSPRMPSAPLCEVQHLFRCINFYKRSNFQLCLFFTTFETASIPGESSQGPGRNVLCFTPRQNVITRIMASVHMLGHLCSSLHPHFYQVGSLCKPCVICWDFVSHYCYYYDYSAAELIFSFVWLHCTLWPMCHSAGARPAWMNSNWIRPIFSPDVHGLHISWEWNICQEMFFLLRKSIYEEGTTHFQQLVVYYYLVNSQSIGCCTYHSGKNFTIVTWHDMLCHIQPLCRHSICKPLQKRDKLKIIL